MKAKIIFGLALVFAATLVLLGCGKKGLEAGTGYIDVPGGKVWYQIYGSGTATPLLIIHGGPGIPSSYLEPLKALSSERPVIFFDQLGAGKSPAPNDTTLWTVDNFVKEIGRIRDALGLKEVHLYGHSWGSQLAVEYMLTKPKGVKSLILAGPSLSIPRWQKDARYLLSTMPDSIQNVIEAHEADGTTDSPEYQSAVRDFYNVYVARTQPWPAYLDSAMATMNPQLYGYMLGPSEFSVTGTLKNFDVTNRLKEITVPTLISIGEYDEVRPETAKYYASLFPDAHLVIVPNAGHLTWVDNFEVTIKDINGFLNEVEGK